MIRNGQDIPSGTVIKNRVCIVGTGPAGVTAAWYLNQAGIGVTLIEGGPNTSRELSWPAKAKLYEGVVEGLLATNESDFLIRPSVRSDGSPWERERIYGGTGNHWGGQCRPLDALTFVERPGFPGWPIQRPELEPYYSQAAQFCMLYSDNFTAEYWAGVLGADVPQLDGIETEMYQFMNGQYTDFATRTYDGKTLAESSVDVIVNANLLNIDCCGGSTRKLTVASMTPDFQKATEFTIEADYYVLACGSIENARQLLLSNVGNENDLVGRYFMCHPISRSPAIFIDKGYLTANQGRLLAGQTPNGPFRQNGVTVQGRFIPSAEQATRNEIGRSWLRPASSSSFGSSSGCYFETAPNRDNRVALAESVDPVFGQSQARFIWQPGEQDRATWEKGNELFKHSVASLGTTVTYSSWEDLLPLLIINGHHIGTTRMANDPAKGVVDKNLRIHSLDNFYVAGASVFPTAGISNPTFTIVALSIRLAEHLSKLTS